uniref:PDE135 n=1 Tax=Arundo donax TaxID=35708 RepID=A0A0A9EY70_ARUDO
MGGVCQEIQSCHNDPCYLCRWSWTIWPWLSPGWEMCGDWAANVNSCGGRAAVCATLLHAYP